MWHTEGLSIWFFYRSLLPIVLSSLIVNFFDCLFCSLVAISLVIFETVLGHRQARTDRTGANKGWVCGRAVYDLPSWWFFSAQKNRLCLYVRVHFWERMLRGSVSPIDGLFVVIAPYENRLGCLSFVKIILLFHILSYFRSRRCVYQCIYYQKHLFPFR